MSGKIKIDSNVSAQVFEGNVHVFLQKHQPLIISAGDLYRKGIELDICSKCKSFTVIICSDKSVSYCSDCFLDLMQKKAKIVTKYWAYYDYETKTYHHIYPSRLQTQMCFPNHKPLPSKGKIVRVKLSELM